ncbi:protein DMP2-like [Impatiens glandulifera]|uniref:protein DMP2-like n=1 Tax=Impatiens glandulifera TaxID=253017 RepID=UPI001FB16F2E|nr:protein DMP2-like [Impatiens glandulifera]
MANDSNKGTMVTTMNGLGNLVKLLPTGTVFTFEFLNPVLSNNGHCRPFEKYVTSFLILVCGLSCFFTTFSDSYTSNDGKTRYGFATFKGIWPSPSSEDSINMNKYKIKLGDFAHATLALMVFAVLALLDSNTLGCFYPGFESDGKKLLMLLPPVIGAFSGLVFAFFPSERHCVGYPFIMVSLDDNNNNNNP